MFYVYKWFIVETGEVIYIGKGIGKRYKVKNRNILFNEMLKRFKCNVEIIKYFDNEQEAFKHEETLMKHYKSLGQCVCNLKYGGNGGVSGIWTDEMKHKMSVENPMKCELQRKRMSENNPMKNPNIAKIVNEQKTRAVIINDIYYNSCKAAGEKLSVWSETIINWCKRGYDTNYNPCRYADEEQKEYEIKISNSKPVIINGIKYLSVKEAAAAYGVWAETIIRCIKNGKLLKGQYECRYDNQQASHEKTDKSIVEASTTNE